MLRTGISQRFKSIPSVVLPCSLANAAALLLHTSSAQHAALAHRTGSSNAKKVNTLIKQEKRRKALETRPHVVLGSRPGDEEKWRKCDLAKILVTEQELRSPTATNSESSGQSAGTAQAPPVNLNFGIGETERQLLFHHLPILSAQAAVLANQNHSPEVLAELLADRQEVELFKSHNFAKIVDLRNANAAGIACENRRRIILAFSSPENPFDPGRSEVQAALLTYRIRNLYFHLTKFRRDVGNRRGLRKLVHHRAKILKYLKQTDRPRYDAVLERLGLEPGSVEGELAV